MHRADTIGMATLAARIPRTRAMRTRPGWIVGSVALLVIAAYGAIRVPTALEMQRALADMCVRVEMQASDWPCAVAPVSTVAVFVPASLLMGVGLALPCAALVATGRRLGAFVPLLLPAGYIAGVLASNELLAQTATADQPVLGIWRSVLSFGGIRETYWSARPAMTALVDAGLIALPLLAGTVFAWRTDRSRGISRRRPPVGAAAAWLAMAVVGTALVVANVFWQRFGSATEMATMLGGGEAWIPTLIVVSFGILLGTDRRFWPWVFVPVAVLLSAAITEALTSTLVRMPAFYRFGAVAPLATAGLIGSAWRPLACAFGRARGKQRGVAPSVEVRPDLAIRDRRRVRPVVVANALAGGIIVVSLIAARFDPLPVQLSTTLPTYLGARQLAEDIVARERLAEAVVALDTHYTDRGTYRGFDVDRSDGVRWMHWSSPTSGDEDGYPSGRIAIVHADLTSVQLVTLSQSGRAICVTSTSPTRSHIAPVTWGQSAVSGSVEIRLGTALTACGDRQMDESRFRMFPIGALCHGADDSSLLLCRSVQQFLRTSLRRA